MSTGLPAASAGNRPNWNLADRLRKAREIADLDQDALSAASGLSRATISAAENGHRVPSRASLAMWALATGVSRSWLTDDEPDPEPAEDVRLRALLAIIAASRRPEAEGHLSAVHTLDAVEAREAEIQGAGDWKASSAVTHPEVLAWCERYRPAIAISLKAISDVGPGGFEPPTSTV